jgi:hypothetical protein
MDAPEVKTQWQAVRRGTESVNELFEIDGGVSFRVMAEDDESKLHTVTDWYCALPLMDTVAVIDESMFLLRMTRCSSSGCRLNVWP